MNYLCPDCRRFLSAADQNMYLSGVCHPNRVMREHDLVYLMAGQWEIRQNGRQYLMEPGDVILLFAGQHHDGITPCQPGTRTLYLHVQPHASDVFCASPEEIPLLDTLIHCQRNPRVKELFESIILEYNALSPMKQQKLSSLFSLLVIELSGCMGETRKNRLVEQTLMRLFSDPSRFFSAEEVASELFVSSRTLRNQFFQEMGESFHQYQIHKKLEEACRLLRDHPDMTLKALAANLGFYDEYHFSKLFKRRYGVSPGRYRKNAGV